MGQKVMTDPFGSKIKIYIFAMVMSMSRKKFVYFQDHPFSASEFVEAHDLAFKYYGGRTQEIVYDQGPCYDGFRECRRSDPDRNL